MESLSDSSLGSPERNPDSHVHARRRPWPRIGRAAAQLFGLFMCGAIAAPATHADSGAFVVTALGDTIAVERYERHAGQMTGAMVFRLGRLRFDYSLALAPDGSVSSMRNHVRPASAPPSSPPTQSAELTWKGDSVLVLAQPGGMQRLASKAGSIPYINPSIALLQVVVQRALAHTPPLDTVQVFAVTGGRTLPAVLHHVNPESVTVSMGAAMFELRVSRDGLLLSGGVPAQMVVFKRADTLPEALLGMSSQDYSAPVGAPYTAEEVRVKTRAGFELAGTLTWPKRPGLQPCVVTITGSGAQDRDGEIGIVRGYRPFRQIADTLARRGIATLRLDDRGSGGSGGSFAGATSADFANDIQDALHWLRGVKDIDSTRLALLGHSEGGLIAPLVASRGERLRAMVLMAGPSWTGQRVMQSQNAFALRRAGLNGTVLDSALAAAMHAVDSLSAVEPWIGFFAKHDPIATAKHVKSPAVLVLQGATDQQVLQEQAAELAAAFRSAGNRDVTVRVLPATDHLFLPDPSGDPAGYTTLPDNQLTPKTLGAIADWLAARLVSDMPSGAKRGVKH